MLLPIPDIPKRTYKVAFLGDSLISGVGATSDEHRFADQFAQRLALPEAYTGLAVSNYGVAGAITREVLETQIPALLRDGKSDLAILIIGTNDIAARIPEAVFELHYRQLIEKITLNADHLLVLNIPKFASTPVIPYEFRDDADAATHRYNAIIKKAIAGNPAISFFDFYDLTEKEFSLHLLSIDGFHPNDAGYARMAEAVSDYFNATRR